MSCTIKDVYKYVKEQRQIAVASRANSSTKDEAQCNWGRMDAFQQVQDYIIEKLLEDNNSNG